MGKVCALQPLISQLAYTKATEALSLWRVPQRAFWSNEVPRVALSDGEKGLALLGGRVRLALRLNWWATSSRLQPARMVGWLFCIDFSFFFDHVFVIKLFDVLQPLLYWLQSPFFLPKKCFIHSFIECIQVVFGDAFTEVKFEESYLKGLLWPEEFFNVFHSCLIMFLANDFIFDLGVGGFSLFLLINFQWGICL